jgi:hypothetical protein
VAPDALAPLPRSKRVGAVPGATSRFARPPRNCNALGSKVHTAVGGKEMRLQGLHFQFLAVYQVLSGFSSSPGQYRRTADAHDSLECAPMIIEGLLDADAAREAAARRSTASLSRATAAIRWTAECPHSGCRTRAGADAHGKVNYTGSAWVASIRSRKARAIGAGLPSAST